MNATTSAPPPLPPPHVPRAPGATPLFSVIHALVLLRLRTLLRPKLLLRFAAMCAGMVLLTALTVPTGRTRNFNEWSVEVFLLRIIPLLCLVTGGGVLRNEIRAYTVEYLWTRPARKSHLVLGAYAGAVTVVLVQVLAFTAVIYLTGAFRGVPDVWSHLPAALVASVGAVLAFTALAVALGVVTGKYMVLGLLYGVVIEIGLSDLPTRLSQLSVTHHLRTLLQSTGAEPTSFLAGAIGCLVLAAAGLAVAACLFTHLTYRIGDEKET